MKKAILAKALRGYWGKDTAQEEAKMAGRFIYVPCMQCHLQSFSKGNLPEPTYYKVFNHNNECEHIIFTCENGHKNIIRIDELDFETLLHVAFEDFNNQYYREAIFNFAAAQERFFEFIINILYREKGQTQEAYKSNLWSYIQKQSERQLGAFCALYFERFGESPISNKFAVNANIRNKVVHQGETPSPDKAKEYGASVIDTIHKVLAKLLENISPEIIHDVRMHKMKTFFENRGLPPENSYITHSHNSIVSWLVQTDDDIEREKRLQKYSQEHSLEYAETAAKANKLQKVLDVDNKGDLILIDPKDFSQLDPNAKYRGTKTFEEYQEQAAQALGGCPRVIDCTPQTHRN